MHHYTIQSALKVLSGGSSPFLEIFKHGSMVLEIYKPEEKDYQTPHSRDEIYIIVKGSAEFYHEGEIQHIEMGDFLFVKAGDEHRFEKFSDDFATWVIFYGPKDGEENSDPSNGLE